MPAAFFRVRWVMLVLWSGAIVEGNGRVRRLIVRVRRGSDADRAGRTPAWASYVERGDGHASLTEAALAAMSGQTSPETLSSAPTVFWLGRSGTSKRPRRATPPERKSSRTLRPLAVKSRDAVRPPTSANV